MGQQGDLDSITRARGVCREWHAWLEPLQRRVEALVEQVWVESGMLWDVPYVPAAQHRHPQFLTVTPARRKQHRTFPIVALQRLIGLIRHMGVVERPGVTSSA